MIDLVGTLAVAMLIASCSYWVKHRNELKNYRDGIFHIVAILDLPMSAWESRYKKMNESEWFGFQRGYQQGLVDALHVLDYKMQIRVHGQTLQPTPGEEESLSDYAQR